jgi:hypothetical protein
MERHAMTSSQFKAGASPIAITAGTTPIAVTVKQACELSGFGQTTVWKFLKEGRLSKLRVPGVDRTLVSYDSLRLLLESGLVEPRPQRRGRPPKARPEEKPEAAVPVERVP